MVLPHWLPRVPAHRVDPGIGRRRNEAPRRRECRRRGLRPRRRDARRGKRGGDASDAGRRCEIGRGLCGRGRDTTGRVPSPGRSCRRTRRGTLELRELPGRSTSKRLVRLGSPVPVRLPGVEVQREPVESISAVTLLTLDMAAAVAFYRALGFRVLYGSPEA